MDFIFQSSKTLVDDLFRDFCNGKSLLALLESLSGASLVGQRNTRLLLLERRLQHGL